MPKEPDMQHIDEFISELDPSELAYLAKACAEAMGEEEAAEEEESAPAKGKFSTKKAKPDPDQIPLEEDDEEGY